MTVGLGRTLHEGIKTVRHGKTAALGPWGAVLGERRVFTATLNTEWVFRHLVVRQGASWASGGGGLRAT